MGQQLDVLLMGCEEDLSKVIFLLHYVFSTRLCIKADPMSLIELEVQTGGRSLKIEKVADVTIPQWNQFQIFLREESNLQAVMTAMRQHHPEFLLEIVPASVYENQVKDENSLLYTMPPVNKERRDLLLQVVDFSYAKSKARFSALKVTWTANITKALATRPDEMKEGQEKLDELFEKKTAQLDEEKAKKVQEIEDAYAEYEKEHGEEDAKGGKAPKSKDPEGDKAKNSLKLNESWRNN